MDIYGKLIGVRGGFFMKKITRMKKITKISVKKSLFIVAMIMINLVSCYLFQYHTIYHSIHLSVVKQPKVEYGTANYDIKKLVDKVDGEIVSVTKDIDTTVVGKQEAIVEIKKDNVVKQVPIVVEVVDTVAPVIEMKEEKVTLTEGDNYNVLSNVSLVADIVDGTLDYREKASDIPEEDTNYYTIEGNIDTNKAGIYPLTIKAVDQYGNVSKSVYNVEVVEKPKPKVPVVQYREETHDELPAIASSNELVKIAYSLIGKPYRAGANGPDAFDCSGFVQYVYSRVGISISRSTSTQIHEGVAVSYEAAQPGDILSWGYVNGVPTHSALYVGNGMMIHATNPRQGVLLSNIAAWTRGSGTRVIAVRRVQV